MSTHDPRKTIELIRNHLSTHDQPLCFLFGAGTSAAINIAPKPKPGERPQFKPLVPAVLSLTDICAREVKNQGNPLSGAWDTVVEECTTNQLTPNVENILSRVQAKIGAMGTHDKTLGVTKDELFRFEKIVRSTITKQASPKETDIPDVIPHQTFAHWIKQIARKNPIEMFTTNYDILLERSLERARIPVFDGFVGNYEPFFAPELLETEELLPPNEWVRLWKLHGSVNWHIHTSGSAKRIVRGGISATGDMILPSHLKYDESRKQPYQALMDRLTKKLSQHGVLLVTCGFSFNDQHINAVLYDSLDNNPQSHIIALRYEPLAPDSPLARAAAERPNLMIVGRDAGVLRSQWGKWRLSVPVDAKTSYFMDDAFDSDAIPDSETEALTGEMRLGDFNKFCRFLTRMESIGEAIK